MTEQQYNFDEEPKKGGIGAFIWNPRTKEFCGRSGLSWCKISIFYAIFYTCLGSFFIGMLAVFFQVMPVDKPTYFGESSTMAQKGLNPGLGFRPQIDVEDSLIAFNPTVFEGENQFSTYSKNLKNFLGTKYSVNEKEADNIIDCISGQDYSNQLINGEVCRFDYENIFKNTSCTVKDNFGYNTNKPCVMIKLNKIVSWKPEVDEDRRIKITCEGETSVDQDNLKNIRYHSENNIGNTDAGYLDAKYFPFYSQPNYRAPFVFVQFDMDPNTFVNVRCIAHAKNIDNTDRMNLRGMTKFGLYVKSN